MRKLITILVAVIAIAIVLSFIKDIVIKISAEKGVELVTGLPLRIQSFRLGLIRQLIGIKRLVLFNPRGFRDRVMLDMPEIYINYDLPAVIKGVIHLEDMRINVKEFTVVKNEKGELNLDSLKVVQASKEGGKPSERKEAKLPKVQIDNLQLKIGKVVYKDYSKGARPEVREFDVNIDEKYNNIANPYAVVSLIVVKAMANTTISGMTGFDSQGLRGTISDTLETAQRTVKDVVKQTAQQTEKAVEKTAEKTKEALKKTTESLKGIFGMESESK